VAGPGEAGHEAGESRSAAWTRRWQPGDRIELDLGMTPRVTPPDRRVDAVRGCVAIERGPLVYCIEAADLPAGVELEGIRLPATDLADIERHDVAPSVVGVRLSGTTPNAIDAIPYFAWANRRQGAMRVWIPTGEGERGA
jgi:DUF1680 family protein